MAGESYRAIGALEMLATLAAVILFTPASGSRALNVCSAATDNRGNSFVLSRWLTTSFPLVAVLMEMAAVAHERSIDLELMWVPRLQNSLADALTNGDFSSFDPSLRLRFDMSQHKGLVLGQVLEVGEALYEEVREHRTKRVKTSSSKEAPLREREPWKD